MKSPTIQKVILTILVVGASLAISARAGTPILSAARQTNASANAPSIHQLLFPDSLYMIDDGTAESDVGLTFGGDLICLNEFGVIPGAEQITDVSIAWGSPVLPDPTLDGLIYTAVLWSDPNGDGNPNDALVLATAPGVVSNQGTNTFLTTNFTPTTITTANFFVGFLVTHLEGQMPAAFDETAPLSNRSYVAGTIPPNSGDIYDLNNNDLPVAPIENYGLIGNWLIRADGLPAGDDLHLLSAASVKGGFAIDLPLTGASGVEDRGGGNTVVMTFNNHITSVESASSTCGSVQSVTIDPTDDHLVTVNFGITPPCNETNVTVSVLGLSDDTGDVLGAASVQIGMLRGDVNGDRVVDSKDVRQITRDRRAQTDSANFREDINLNGRIENSDLSLAMAQAGTSLP